VNRPKIGVLFTNKLVKTDPLKNYDFLGVNRSMSYLSNTFRILHSVWFGKSYGRFAKTAQDKSELCTIVFQLNFSGRIMVIGFYTMNESVAGLSKLFILGFYSSIRGRE